MGLRLRLENVSTGERASAGSAALLAPQTQWNARLGYVWFGWPFAETELFLRVNNLLDQELWSQTGLPEAGQTFWSGLRVRL
jgi:outer membrane receptor protein involved in Fe transport